MFDRCPGLAMNAAWTLATSGPYPTFSPTHRKLRTSCASRGLWYSVLLDAIRRACARATATRSLRVVSRWTPRADRAALIFWVTLASVVVAPAGCAVTAPVTKTARVSARVVRNATMRCGGCSGRVSDTGKFLLEGDRYALSVDRSRAWLFPPDG